jgi:hypothetical protein
MKLNVISWNIRHLRMDKVKEHLAQILAQVDAAHLMFFYENKDSNPLGGDFVSALGEPLSKSKGAGSMRLEWAGVKYPVGTNENVLIVYSKKCTTGPKSKQGEGLEFTIQVKALDGEYKGMLTDLGLNALKSSCNLTIMSNLAQGKTEFRVPAVVQVTLTKPKGDTKDLRIAAWHAPGPAQGSAPLLNYCFQTYLHNKIDLFVGDFNMTGLDANPSGVNLPLSLFRTNSSTTITPNGPVQHPEGLDLVYGDGLRLANGAAVGPSQIGRANVSVVPLPPGVNFQDAYALSDHRPVLVTLKGL